MIKNIGFAITGSFCTHEKIIPIISDLKDKGYNIIPIVSTVVTKTNTRFGNSEDFINKLKDITKNNIIDNIVSAEPIGPKNMIDALVIAPCTGNTLAKLANAITDNAVTMVAKSLMRNNKPIIIGISTNDALGLNAKNIATLLNSKSVFFIPFGQDDYLNKPKSLIADWSQVYQTILSAEQGVQLQPILLNKN